MIIMESQPREIQRYVTSEGKVPFAEWLEAVRDRTARAKINLGDYRSVGEGVFEFKINYGPGYRVYFGQVGFTLILLLCGGDKSTQQKDIQKAKEYWRNYHARR